MWTETESHKFVMNTQIDCDGYSNKGLKDLVYHNSVLRESQAFSSWKRDNISVIKNNQADFFIWNSRSNYISAVCSKQSRL